MAEVAAVAAVAADGDAYDRGRAAWPAVLLDRRRFEARLAELGGDARYAEDLYLATACAASLPAALAAFERAFLVDVPLFIARIDSSPQVVADLQQALREHLLVAPVGQRPRIAEYSGRGPLRGWLRVTAVRKLHHLRRHDKPTAALESVALDQLTASGPDPERALMEARHRRDFEQALRSALQALTSLDRALLRLHVVDGRSIDELCLMHGVHRATVARRLQRLKQRIFDDAIELVGLRLNINADETESLLDAVRSHIDVSLTPLYE
jgi:RNA polymerase sigma-70 factor (ECF subfamily)